VLPPPKAFLDQLQPESLDQLPPLAALRELEPEPMLAFDDDRIHQACRRGQTMADEPAVEVGEETSFNSCWLS
jgi:segregation and condensation protein B